MGLCGEPNHPFEKLPKLLFPPQPFLPLIRDRSLMVLKWKAASHAYLMGDHPSFVCGPGTSVRWLSSVYSRSLSLSDVIRFFHATALEVTVCCAALVRWFKCLSLRFPFHKIGSN